jgi:hypothetical protein
MKTILLWDPRFPDRRPARLTVEDTVASAAVRAGVAAAANPAEAGALSAGGAIDPTMLTEVVLQHGPGTAMRRVFLPYSVVMVGAAAGVLAAIGTPIPGGVTPTPTPSPTLTLSATSPSIASNAAAGTLVSNISNVPAGATPTVTPNDGRLVIAGDSSAGWKVVVGMSALSAGTVNFSVGAPSATGASAVLTVTALAAFLPSAPATAAFDGAEPSIDLRDGAYKVGTTTYPTIAAMVTAGIYTQITPGATTMQNGDQLVLPAAMPTTFTLRGEGTTAASNAANGVAQTMISFEDAGTTINDELFQIGRQYTSTGATNRARLVSFVGNASQANYQDTNGTLTSNNAPVIISASATPNNYRLSYLGRNSFDQTTTATVSSGLTRMIIGNQSDGTRSWGGTVTRITVWPQLFAKTQMSALSLRPFDGQVRGAYTGNIKPHSAVLNGKLYVGQTEANRQAIVEIDPTTRVMTDFINVGSAYGQNDDHRCPVFIVTPGGKALTFYTGHGDDSVMRYRRSTDATFRNLGAEQTISYAAIGVTTYPCIHVHAATGHIYVLCRSSLLKWAFIMSTDDGLTWSTPAVLTFHPDRQSYIYGEWVTASRLRFFVNENSELDASLKMMEWDVVTGEIFGTGGAVIGNSATGGASFNDMMVWQAYSGGRSFSMMEWGPTPNAMLYSALDDNAETCQTYVASLATGADAFTKANWTTTALTPAYTGASDQRRFSGQADFSRRSDLSAPRAYVSQRVGTNWVIEKIDFTAANLSTFTRETIRTVPDTNYNAAMRPRCPVGSDGKIDVTWQEGLYPSFSSWLGDSVNRKWAI